MERRIAKWSRGVAALWVCAVALAGAAASAQPACGGPDAPCTLENGRYHLALPEGVESPPVFLHLHGFGSSGRDVIRNRGFVDRIRARGYAVLAPTALPRAGASANAWNFRFNSAAAVRDDVAFIAATLDDAAARFGVDRARVLATGFSIGGSMTWRLACDAPEIARAFAPLAGGFWEPFPERCGGVVKLFHTHGWSDMTVPLEGRFLGGAALASGDGAPGSALQQGDIFKGLALWREFLSCANLRATEFEQTGPFWRRRWTTCTDGAALELALHPGGHGAPPPWSDMVIDWFEQAAP